MSEPGEVKALIFDVFGTCVDWRSGIAREAAAAAKAAGLSEEEFDALDFATAWRSHYQPMMEPVRQGVRPWTILDQLHRESLDRILEDAGLGERFDEAARVDLTKAWWRLDPWPDVLPGLTRLKQGRFIAPCSNGNIALIANMAKRAGLPWDLVLGAETARAYKPNQEAYLRACEMLGLAPAEVAMVAAHNDDLFAARHAGLLCAFVPRPTEHGPGQTKDLEPLAGWDWVATDFEDLARQLGV